jgi:hypothetical protein
VDDREADATEAEHGDAVPRLDLAVCLTAPRPVVTPIAVTGVSPEICSPPPKRDLPLS